MPASLPDSLDPALVAELAAVHAFYAALAPRLDPACGLGGQLLYAGQLTDETAHLLRAANIAGAASLAASDSPALLKENMRAGVVDFAVNSLDEALRILKNEIRKRLPVAVAVQGVPQNIANEMLLRGVQPDLLAPAFLDPLCARATFLARGAALVEPQPASDGFRIWQLPAVSGAHGAELDAKLLALLPAADLASHRWLSLAPRYLPRSARRLRSLACNRETASKIDSVLASIPAESSITRERPNGTSV